MITKFLAVSTLGSTLRSDRRSVRYVLFPIYCSQHIPTYGATRSHRRPCRRSTFHDTMLPTLRYPRYGIPLRYTKKKRDDKNRHNKKCDDEISRRRTHTPLSIIPFRRWNHYYHSHTIACTFHLARQLVQYRTRHLS